MADEQPLEKFPSWIAVLTWIESGYEIFYHAPMDRRPVRVTARRGKGSHRYKVKVTPRTNDADPFWTDLEHFDRFRRIPQQRQRILPPEPPALTMHEFTPAEHTRAKEVARRLGYKQYAYTSSSQLWGYFCLPENPEHHPNAPHQQRIIIATKELGIVVVQDLEDLHMGDLWEQQTREWRKGGSKE